MTASQVYELVKDSVVVVKAYDRRGKPVGLGSGVRLPDGDIITNYHVVKEGVRYKVALGKQVVSATIKGGDPGKDLALLTAPGLVAKTVRLGKTATLKVGDPVYAVGAPQGLELSLSEGIVSQLRGRYPHIIQTTVAISPGSSGGGLFNAKGELVGITTFYLKGGQSLNFALPVEWIGRLAMGKIRERPTGGTVAPEPETRPKDDWLNQAMAMEKANDRRGLLTHSRHWTRAEPSNPLAWFALGIAYTKLGRYREAIKAYRESLRLKPDIAATWYDLGLVYGKMGRNREAIKACLEALRLRPNYPKAWSFLALSYARSGNRSAALKAVKELRRYDPQKADKLFNLIMP